MSRSLNTPVRTDLRTLAMAWIFPSLIITEVVANQPWWIGGVQPGQILGWLLIAAFAVILLPTPGLGAWPTVLVGALVAAKIGSWMSGVQVLESLYSLAYVAVAAIVGSVLAVEMRGKIRRQAGVLMVLSAPLMFLQVAGAGAWTQVLTTHGTLASGESVSKEAIRTLFRPLRDLSVGVSEFSITNVQLRPAGFLHASEFASLIIIFTFGLLLTSRGPRNRLFEAAVCVTAVLAMAKIVFLAAGITIAWAFLGGDRRMKERASFFAKCLTLGIGLYWWLFPGLFVANLGMQAFAFSVLSRAYDVAKIIGFDQAVNEQLFQIFEQTMEVSEGSLSGIGQIVRYFPYFMLGMIIFIPQMVRAHRRMRSISPAASQMAATMTLAVALFLIGGRTSPVFWFCMGFGLFPLLSLFAPRYLRIALMRGVRMASRRRDVPSARLAPSPSPG